MPDKWRCVSMRTPKDRRPGQGRDFSTGQEAASFARAANCYLKSAGVPDRIWVSRRESFEDGYIQHPPEEVGF